MREAPVRTPRDKFAYLALLAALVAGLIVHLASGGVFVLDDHPSILENAALVGSPVSVILQSPFRAITVLLNWSNVQAAGFDAPAFEAVNGVLHVITSLLVFLLVRALFAERENPDAIALAASAIFCLNPLINFSVFYISARSAVLATMFTVGAALAYLEHLRKGRNLYLWISMLACVGALLSKESGAVAPIMVCVLAFLYGKGRERIKAVLPAGGIFVIYAVLRSGHLVYLGPSSELPGAYEYFLTQLTVIPGYIAKFLWPTGLALEQNPVLRTSLLDAKVIISGVGLIAVWGILTYKLRKNRPALFLMIWMPVALGPESGVIPLMDLAFLHRVYMPAVGLVGIIAFGGGELFGNEASSFKRKAAPALVVVVCSLFLMAAVEVASTWSSKITVHRRSVRVSPDKFRARYDLGLAYKDELRYVSAWPHLNRAVEIGAPTDYEQANAFNALGKLHFRFKDYRGAAFYFLKASELRQGWAEPLENAGLAHLKMGRFVKALDNFKEASRLSPPDAQIRRAIMQARKALEASRGGRR